MVSAMTINLLTINALRTQTRRLEVQDQPGLQNKTLFQKKKPGETFEEE
jgi:hypothetical protein